MFEFWRFKSINLDTFHLLSSDFNTQLVVISVAVAILASYSTLIILDRIWVTDNDSINKMWLWFGSFVLGLGVWAMHYTGMLAYIIPMSFSPVITALSIVPIFIGTYFILKQLSLLKFKFLEIQLSALVFALAIGLMHFIGMEAMQSNAVMSYNLGLFLVSLLIAHLLATVTLYLIVLKTKIKHYQISVQILCSITMGGTVAGMHYTAMTSVSYYLHKGLNDNIGHLGHGSLVIPITIAAVISILVITTISCAFIDQRLQAAEQSFKNSVIRENDIVEHLPDGVLVIAASGQIISANAAAVTMFNRSSNSLNDCKIEELIPSITYEQLVDDVILFDHTFLGQTIIIEGIKKNGETFPVEAHFSKMTLVIDYQVMFNCVMRDITKRVDLEKQLSQAQKLESIGQLASGIAHEINTPIQYVTDNCSFLNYSFESCLSVIKASQAISKMKAIDITQDEILKLSELIEEADIDFMVEEIPSAITQSLEGLEIIASIVKAMKSFSHPSKGEMQLTSITEVIETTITVARNEWRYVAELNTQFDERLPKVMCIRDELNQVILNMIVNATHAIEEKNKDTGSSLGKIDVTSFKQKNHAVIRITDNGVGMTSEVKNRIFDPFFTTKGVGKGTGQGLNLAYTVIVERHKGKITADSTLGKGTTFTISLPLESKYSPTEAITELAEDVI